MVQFSPLERYVLTFSETLSKKDNPEDPQAYLIWDLQNPSKPIRGFPFKDDDSMTLFKWSYDEKYFSRIKDGFIYIFETPSMVLTLKDPNKPGDQRIPLKLHSKAQSHAWSPTSNYLAVYVPTKESGDIPARVTLLDFPNTKPIATKSLVNVHACHIHWQSQGKYLAIKIDRSQKTKKSPVFTSFEFFRVQEKNIPIEGVELSKDNVIAFSFEPGGTRFAIIHADATQSTGKPNVSIYNIERLKIVLLKTFEQRLANHLYWSPAGRYLLIAGLKQMNGQLEFLDVETMESIAKDTHQLCTDVAWDFTGRFVASYVSNWKTRGENGFIIWSCRGRKIYSLNKDPFFQLSWRPQPPPLMTKEELQSFFSGQNFKKFQKKYRLLEKEEQDAIMTKRKIEQEKSKSDYRTLLQKRLKEMQEDVVWRKSMGITEVTDLDLYTIEDVVEETLEEKTEVLI